MARRARRGIKRGLHTLEEKDNPVTDAGLFAASDPAIEAMIQKIKREPIADWGLFIPSGMTTVQALKQDGTYRTAPLDGSEEFSFAGLRIGKRGKMIFEFLPVDTVYKLYEIDQDKVFSSIAPSVIDESTITFEERIVSAIGGVIAAGTWDQPGEGYAAARSAFCAGFRRTIAEVKKEAEVIKQKENVERMEDNPLWGSF